MLYLSVSRIVYKFILLFLFPLFIYSIDWPALTEELFINPKAYDLQPVDNGATNSNYSFKYEGQHYFIRRASPNMELLNSSMEIEYEVLQALKEYRIAPLAFYFNKEKKILVTEFIKNDKVEIDLKDPLIRHKVLSLLHKIGSLNIKISREYQPYQDILKYAQIVNSLGDELPEVFYQEMVPALRQMNDTLSKNIKYQLCHFDLHHGNILKNGDNLWIIDWEYAVMSDSFLNLASMASIERWDDQQMEILLKDYMLYPEKEDFYRLYLYRIVIDIHWAAWNRLQNKLSLSMNLMRSGEKLFFDAALERINSPLYLEALNHLNRINKGT